MQGALCGRQGLLAEEDFAEGGSLARDTHECPLLFSLGLTDEEIDLAFQQSGTAADEPSPLGPATPVVPVQPPHLTPQPYSKSPVPSPAYPSWESRHWLRAVLQSSHLSKLGELGFSI